MAMSITSVKHQKGMTLLEVILVLAIGMAIVLLGIRQYQVYRQQQLGLQLQAQVDTLFQGMAHYYQVNCRDRYKSDRTLDPKTGKLSPSSITYPPAASQPVELKTITDEFLAKNWNPANPLVNRTSNAYKLQFNPKTSTRNISTHFYSPIPESRTAPEEIKAKNTVVTWMAQVAVRMNDVANIDLYKGILGATCVSSLKNNIVLPCDQATPGEYLVWERLPSLTAANTNSGLWPATARAKQFVQQYTNDDFYAFNRDDRSWDSGNYEIYLCGG